MLAASHVAAFDSLRAGLACHGPVPHLDPCDGGNRARVLILLETPGPGVAAIRFVSRDNRTGTAANLRRFCAAAGLRREDTVLWNAVPWIVHEAGSRNRPLHRAEITEGLAALPAFLALLPNLQAAVLAGRVAQQAARVVATACPDAAIFTMPHPSPIYVNTAPSISGVICGVLRQAAEALR